MMQTWIDEVQKSGANPLEKDLKIEFANRFIFQIQMLNLQERSKPLTRQMTIQILNKIRSQETRKMNQTSAHFTSFLPNLIDAVESDLEKSEDPVLFVKDYLNQVRLSSQSHRLQDQNIQIRQRDYFDGKKSLTANELDPELIGLAAELQIKNELPVSGDLQTQEDHNLKVLGQSPSP